MGTLFDVAKTIPGGCSFDLFFGSVECRIEVGWWLGDVYCTTRLAWDTCSAVTEADLVARVRDAYTASLRHLDGCTGSPGHDQAVPREEGAGDVNES